MKKALIITSLIFILLSCNNNNVEINDVQKIESQLKEIEKVNSKSKKYFILNKLYFSALKIEVDSQRIRLLNQIFKESNFNNNYNLSRKINIAFAKQPVKKNVLEQANLFKNKASYFRMIGMLDSAYYFFNESKKDYDILKKYNEYGSSLYGLAELESKFNDYNSSEIKLKKIIELSKQIDDKKLYYISCIALGNNYKSSGDYISSIKYHKIAYKYYIDNRDKIHMSYLHRQAFLNNIGNVYKEMGLFDTAKTYFKKALSNKKVLLDSDLELFGLLKSNLGYCYLQNNQLEKALESFEEAKKAFFKVNNFEELSYLLINESKIFLKNGNTLKSNELSKQSLNFAKKSKANRCELYILEKIIEQSEDNKSLFFDYLKLKNKIENNENLSRNRFYKIELETNQIEQEKKQLETQRNQAIWVGVIIFLILAIIFINYRNRIIKSKYELNKKHQKSNEIIQELITQNQAIEVESRQKEQRRIAMEIHDNVLNQLASVRYRLFKLNFTQDPNALNDALYGIENIRQVEVELRNLTHNLTNQSQLEHISLKQMIEQLIVVHHEIYGQNVIFEMDTWDWEKLPAETKLCLVRMIQEALFNTAKHAKADNILIAFTQIDGRIKLRIKDDGKGFELHSIQRGIGLQNMETRAAQIQAKIEILTNRNQGTEIIVESL
jgi:signal transduction histidine kinase